MRILYIYPHPDDESFGPARVMLKQLRQGHEVFLLTLTRGGATKQRFKYDYSVEEMGSVRFEEMQRLNEVLGLSGMTILDLPDSGLKEMDPREIEKVLADEVEKIKPAVLVSYAVHGISGFHDHLVTHAVVKRVFVELRESKSYLKRLALVTVSEIESKKSKHFPLSFSTTEEIDCVVEVDEEDIKKSHLALDCYVTFQETIEKSGIKGFIGREASFELYQENFDPPLRDLFERLP